MAQLSDDCFAFGGPLLAIDEVERLINERVTPVAESETVALWDASNGRRVAQASCAGVRATVIAVAPGGRFVAFGGNGSYLWDTASAQPRSNVAFTAIMPPNGSIWMQRRNISITSTAEIRSAVATSRI